MLKPFAIRANEFIKDTSNTNNIFVGDTALKYNGVNLENKAQSVLFIDTIHPNAKGHKLIAQSLMH